MTMLRNYRFELCWLLLVIVLYAWAPARTSATAYDWEEAGADCPHTSGWCPMGLLH